MNNKIIISKHAIQRREHSSPIDKDILINLVKQIDDKFVIPKKENNKYKIGFRNIDAVNLHHYGLVKNKMIKRGYLIGTIESLNIFN